MKYRENKLKQIKLNFKGDLNILDQTKRANSTLYKNLINNYNNYISEDNELIKSTSINLIFISLLRYIANTL